MYSLEYAYKKYMDVEYHHNDRLYNKPNQPLTLILIIQKSAISLQLVDAYLICKNIFLEYETPTH